MYQKHNNVDVFINFSKLLNSKRNFGVWTNLSSFSVDAIWVLFAGYTCKFFFYYSTFCCHLHLLTAQWLLYIPPALSFITLYISDVLYLHILLILGLNIDYFCKWHSLTILCNGDTVWFFSVIGSEYLNTILLT